MARTGFSVNVSNTVMGTPPSVNANTMLIVTGTATTGSTFPVALDTPVLFKSVDDLETHGITEDGNPNAYRQITDFYNPTTEVNNTGTYLWVVLIGHSDAANVVTKLPDFLRATVVNGFQYRPRQIVIAVAMQRSTLPTLQSAIMSMYDEGFSTCAIIAGDNFMKPVSIETGVSTMDDLSTQKAGMVGVVIFTDVQKKPACVGKVGGWMASLPVGTSIGDTSLPAFGDSLYMCDKNSDEAYVNTPCAQMSLATVNTLGDKQYIFPRTRPPKNGLWLNDGATAGRPGLLRYPRWRPLVPSLRWWTICVRSTRRILTAKCPSTLTAGRSLRTSMWLPPSRVRMSSYLTSTAVTSRTPELRRRTSTTTSPERAHGRCCWKSCPHRPCAG